LRELSQWTNAEWLWSELGLENYNCFLWSMCHERRYETCDLYHLEGWQKADYIFLIDAEGVLYRQALDLDPRIYFWDSAFFDHPRFKTNLGWFTLCKNIETDQQSVSKLVCFKSKKSEYFFDALLGTMEDRPHKKWVYAQIQKESQTFLVGSLSSINRSTPPGWIMGGDYEGEGFVHYNETQTASRACFVPYEIYNNTWYSLICETKGTGDCFFTEKTAKPLIAKRLFVLFAPQYSLKYLKSVGFQTFDLVIDESYDNIENDLERCKQAWNQVEYLLREDPLAIYEKIQPIVEHNHNLIMKQNWHQIMLDQMHKILKKE
jgi:hypothetical protein